MSTLSRSLQPQKLVPGSCAVHFIARGQTLHIPMFDSHRMQPVRLSAQLINRLRPVHLSDPLSEISSTSVKAPTDPRTKAPTNGLTGSVDEGTVILGKRMSSKPPVEGSDATRPYEETSSPSNNKSFMALVDGFLDTRDGKRFQQSFICSFAFAA